MRRVHLVGRSGHGKTTLSELLLAHWVARGLRVGSIKHTGHIHELDMPGKDSWRHRQAGAVPTTVVAGDRLALHLPLGDGDDPYALLAPHYASCDLVLVEGHLATCAPRVEVWRAALGEAPLAAAHAGIAAVITDDAYDLVVPIWPRTDVAGIAERLLALAG
jgi:molybdopterin-guanine dinucleotide biosynthesis adapter protein